MAWDPVWEQIFSNLEWGKYPPEDFIRFIARNFYGVENRKKIRILEVGCGPGANLWFLAREGFTVYGIDGSETAINKAKKRLNSECPNWQGELVVGDISSLPYEDEFFNAVVDIEAIYCNAYAVSKKIYDELARVSIKGGGLYSRTFATGCWGDKTGQSVGHNAWVVGEGPMSGKGYTRFTCSDEITDLMRGFNVKSVEMLMRTVDNREHEIKEWIILGEKKTPIYDRPI
jgi:ubiquinone/menaquinone biosynthesis C-methylase UbiE